MTYFLSGSSSSNSSAHLRPRPFVEFSPQQDRASLMTALSSSSPLSRSSTSSSGGRRRRSRRRRQPSRRRNTRSTRVRVIHGRVALRVGGYPGLQHLGASQLVRFVPLNKLRAAARRVLGGSAARKGKRTRRTRRSGGRVSVRPKRRTRTRRRRRRRV